jgi:hypothetical protein
MCSLHLRAHGAASAIALGVASVASAQHPGDVNPTLIPAEGKSVRIQTNQIDGQGGVVEGQRIFDADFGNSGFPEFTADPGFDALPGTFTPGTRVGFHAPEGLLRFTGASLVPVGGERLEVSFLTLTTTIGPSPDIGFDLAVQSNGGWHRHLSYEIFDETLPLPAAGIYVLPMTLYSTDPSVLESERFWMVFDYGAGQTAQDEARAFIEATLLAPTCAADLDGDGAVGPGDLAVLLGGWGQPGPSDLDGDGAVTPSDLATLLGAWGSCP